MKLYVCHGTFPSPRPGGHPCGNAYKALQAAGYDPEIQKVRGWDKLPGFLNGGRKEVEDLTGQITVPVLVTDDGEAVYDSKKIIAWAQANPASA